MKVLRNVEPGDITTPEKMLFLLFGHFTQRKQMLQELAAQTKRADLKPILKGKIDTIHHVLEDLEIIMGEFGVKR